MLTDLLYRVRALFHRNAVEDELDNELRFHFDRQVEKYVASGLDRAEAVRQARLKVGGLEQLKEECREARGLLFLETVLKDCRYALRMMRRSPGFTVVAVLSLALGIGANTAIFSLVNAVLLRPLPYRNVDRLVAVWEWNIPHRHINTVAAANYRDWRNRSHVFEDLGYSWDEGYTFTSTGNPESVPGYTLSANFFQLLGAKSLLGRTFAPEEGQTGRDHVVVLSYKLWQRRFAGDRNIVGRNIQLNHEVYTVIGVMPPEFAHPGSLTALWTPLAITPDFFENREIHVFRVFARLKHGVTLAKAQAEMDAIATQLAKEHPSENAGSGVQLWPIRDFYVGTARTPLMVLQIAVFMMLLIACANIANLLMARAGAREREVAVRLALGAGKLRLFRQFLTEGILLAMFGGAAGVVLALWGVEALQKLLPSGFAGYVEIEHGRALIKTPVLLFTVLLSTAAGMMFGAAPAFRGSASPNETLKAGGRSFTEGRRKMRLRSGLVVSQMALSLVLLIAAGLMIRSFLRLERRDFGYRTDHVLTLQVSSTSSEMTATMARFLGEVTERIETLPGVESAGAINTLPLTGAHANRNFTIPGQPELSYSQQNNADFRVITPHYPRALGIRLLRGRYFDERDRQGGRGVVLINETLAKRYFPNEDPIGRRIRVADAATPETREIIGVVGDTRHHELALAPVPEIYRPFGQADWPFAWVVVRTSGDPLVLANEVRSAIWAINKEQPINSVVTMEHLAADSLAPRRANMILLALFAAIALLLSAIGIYGVMAYSVARRSHEIGIRMALGAHERDVLGMVLRQAVLLALGGVALGLSAAFGVTRLMRSLLVEGVSATDSATFVAIPVLLCAVAGLAAYLPAWRASRVDPMVVLHYE